MHTASRAQILDNALCISHNANTVGKNLNPSIFALIMGKLLGGWGSENLAIGQEGGSSNLIIQIFPLVFVFCILTLTPHDPDDGSVEPKRYSVDLNKSLLPLGSLLSFFLHIVGLQSFIYISYIYIYIYIYISYLDFILGLYIYIYMGMILFTCISKYSFICLHLFVLYLSVHAALYFSTVLFRYLWIFLFTHLGILLHIFLSIYLGIYPAAFFFVHSLYWSFYIFIQVFNHLSFNIFILHVYLYLALQISIDRSIYVSLSIYLICSLSWES